MAMHGVYSTTVQYSMVYAGAACAAAAAAAVLRRSCTAVDDAAAGQVATYTPFLRPCLSAHAPPWVFMNELVSTMFRFLLAIPLFLSLSLLPLP